MKRALEAIDSQIDVASANDLQYPGTTLPQARTGRDRGRERRTHHGDYDPRPRHAGRDLEQERPNPAIASRNSQRNAPAKPPSAPTRHTALKRGAFVLGEKGDQGRTDEEP